MSLSTPPRPSSSPTLPTTSSLAWDPQAPDPRRPTAADRALARAAPAGFAYVASGGLWIPAPHLLLISRLIVSVVESIRRRESRRVMVFMPPRHGKSELISKYTPAWFLGTNPDLRVILASYGATLAFRLSRQARDVLADVGQPLLGVGVDPSVAARDRWDVEGEHRGGMLAAGVGGGITGEGAHLFVIDDPVKDAEEAASEVIQERNLDWWRATARTRLMPGGACIVLQTRWHEADLSGEMLRIWREEDADAWEVLSLPAIAEEEDDALGRSEGEALWPEMYDEVALAKTRRTLGVYFFAALYQQRPMPAGGGVFKREDFRYFYVDDEHGVYVLHDDAGDRRVGIDHCYHFATADTATSTRETADYTVISRWAVTPWKDLLLLEVVRERFDTPDQPAIFRNAWRAWRLADLRVERTVYSITMIRDLVREGLPIVPLEADTDKVTRARGAVPRYEAHAVYHLVGAPWLDRWERELLVFPNGKNDDQVDTFSYAAKALPDVGVGRQTKRADEVRPRAAGIRRRQL